MTSVTVINCAKCRGPIYVPPEVDAFLRSSHQTFHCLHGHPQSYREGPSEEDKLRQERDRLKQRLAEKDDTISYYRNSRDAAQRQASAFKGVVTRLKNRAANGVCPCCNRSFADLRRHMASKHPDFSKQEEVPA